MKSTQLISKILFLVVFTALSLSAQAEGFKLFWLTETISGATAGPVSSEPGTRFIAAGKQWTVLASKPGQIFFADSQTGVKYGPYDFMPKRIIELGDVALAFTRVDNFSVKTDVSANQRVASARANAAENDQPLKRPKRWDPKPLPSTNPADHEPAPENFSMQMRIYPPAFDVWAEPLHDVKYNWSVGSYAGNSGADMKMTRIGASGTWHNWFAEISKSQQGKTSGTVVPDETYLSDLGLAGGAGFALRGGYRYSFVVDGNWNVSFGGYASYEHTEFDMNATVFTRHGEVVSSTDIAGDSTTTANGTTTVSYSFENYTEAVEMDEMTLTALGGIDYTSAFWGVGAFIQVDMYSENKFSGSVSVADETYKLSANRTDLVGIGITGWYSPFLDYFVTGSASVGSENALRIGFGKKF